MRLQNLIYSLLLMKVLRRFNCFGNVADATAAIYVCVSIKWLKKINEISGSVLERTLLHKTETFFKKERKTFKGFGEYVNW